MLYNLFFIKISITYIKIYLPLKIMINIPLLSKKKEKLAENEKEVLDRPVFLSQGDL